MADFWIKVCKDTPSKRELAIIAQRMGRTKADIFYWWFLLYSWADGQTANGFLPHMDIESISTAAGVPTEFCLGLGGEDVGWLYEVESTPTRPAGMMFSHWDRHNGKSAKKRAQQSQRQRRWRKGV
jgi:hypothetical protein